MEANLIVMGISGFTLAIGFINLHIALYAKNSKSYLFFGLLSVFASLFFFAQSDFLQTAFSSFGLNVLSLTLAVAFYSFFLWFIQDYTSYKNQPFLYGVTAFLLGIYLSFFLIELTLLSFKIWELGAHLGIALIALYGLIGGIRNVSIPIKFWEIVFVSLMGVLLLMTFVVGISYFLDIALQIDPIGFASLLDFFPVLFSSLIGAKMSHDIVKGDLLETEIQVKEEKWAELTENISTLLVELDKQGQITYVNQYFAHFVGYSKEELLGKDWFALLLKSEDKEASKKVYQRFIAGQRKTNNTGIILTSNGEEKSIEWANKQVFNLDKKISGILAIGTDVTEREKRLKEIVSLKNKLEKENLMLSEKLTRQLQHTEIIGESDSIQYAIKRALQVADTDATVLLEGETGVGKELFANMIFKHSSRNTAPFIKVNCAAIPKELFESELFGHEKGAFTGANQARSGRFELAHDGTLFLDEIGDLPLSMQSKLLRVLQSGEFEKVGSEKTETVNVRVVAATNKNLLEEVKRGNFREDLYYRLNVYPLTIPPLRKRKDDIPILVKFLVKKLSTGLKKNISNITKSDLLLLTEYDWPGNVRELENTIERAVINSTDQQLQIELPSGDLNLKDTHITLATSLDSNAKVHIEKVLHSCDWKINGPRGAAELLGIPPSTLRSKMKKLKIARKLTS